MRSRLWFRRLCLGAALGLVLTACGTRLPNSSFQLTQGATNGSGSNLAAGQSGSDNGNGNGVSGTGDNGTGNGTSTGPGGSSTGPGGSSSGPGGSSSGPGTGTNGSGTSGSKSGPNQASDVGVTPTSITIGNVTGVSGPLGPDAFGPTLLGLKTWVGSVNASGGINGRKVILDTCDDGQDGARNLACVQQLVGSSHVFALLDNNSLATAPSAHYEYSQGVPDLGLPLNNGYYKYPNMFSVYGTAYPRDGHQVGYGGQGSNDTAIYRFMKQKVGVTKGAFFFYNEASSQQQGYSEEQQSQAEGIQITYESGGHQGENLGAANWDADVLAMKDKGVDGVFDAVDIAGNEKICASMDRYGVHVKAKLSTIEVWSQNVGSSAWSSPCRNSVFVAGSSVPYQDTSVPIIGQFRKDFGTYERGATLHQWAVDAYGVGLIFADAVSSMGPTPTRKGFISWMDGVPLHGYTAHGIFAEVAWAYHPPGPGSHCYAIVQWQDSAGTYVTRSGPNEFSCYTTNDIAYPISDDGS